MQTPDPSGAEAGRLSHLPRQRWNRRPGGRDRTPDLYWSGQVYPGVTPATIGSAFCPTKARATAR